MKVTCIKPHGFCPGVRRALEMADVFLKEHDGKTVISIGTIVHNEDVIEDYSRRGLHFGEADESYLSSLPDGSAVLFPAHGHDPKWDDIASKKHFLVCDATCPFVKKNADIIKDALRRGEEILYIGEPGHAESVGAIAIDPTHIHLISKPTDIDSFRITSSLTVVSQTTMGEDEIIEINRAIATRFPEAKFAAKPCLSTEERQNAVSTIPGDVDLIIVLGSETSNNTIRLKRRAEALFPNVACLQALNWSELKKRDLSAYRHAALLSGASTDDRIYEEVYRNLCSIGN